MSSIEERLARDIAAVTEGVVMTESDLRDAREILDGRIESRRQHDRRRTLLAAGAAAAVVVAIGVTVLQTLGGEDKTAPPANQPSNSVEGDADFLLGEPPTPELVEGVWRVDNGTELILFNRDGTMRYDSSGQLFSSPAATGTYEIDGGQITGIINSGTAECVGREFAIRVSLPSAGEMRTVDTQPATGGCAPGPDYRGVLEHVLPMGASLRGLGIEPGDDFAPADGPRSLYGVWFAVADDPLVQTNDGGFVLELGVNHRYVIAATGDLVGRSTSGGEVAVINQGAWRLEGTRLIFESEGGAPNDTGNLVCDAGETFVMTGVALAAIAATALRGTFAENSCASGWAPTQWLRLPQDEN